MWSYALIALAAAAAQGPAAAKCTEPEHHSVDYMIGDWRIVQTVNGEDFADDRVGRVHDGCAVRENLRLRDGTIGSSLSFFKPADGLWHLFYHDSTGLSGHLTGVTDARGRLELSGDNVISQAPQRTVKFRQVQYKDEAGSSPTDRLHPE